MRSAPHRRFSVAMRRMSSTTSGGTRGGAGGFFRERHLQNNRKPSRCQRRRVSGLNEQEGVAPAGGHAGKGDEKEAVPGMESRLRRSARSDGELMPQKGVLGEKFLGGPQEVGEESSGDAGGSARRRQARPGNSAGGGASAVA